MAAFVFTDAYLSVGGVLLSDHVRSVTINASADVVESTAMGATYKARLPGLKDFSLSVEFNNDYATSSVEPTVYGFFGTSQAFEFRPTSAAVSATNPKYTGSAIVSKVPIGGKIGDLASLSVDWPGNGALARATS
jgi:hypothetical protein